MNDRDVTGLMRQPGDRHRGRSQWPHQDARPGHIAGPARALSGDYLGYPPLPARLHGLYFIADPVVAPDQAFYTEAIVHLPDSYFVSARPPMPRRRRGARPACRKQAWYSAASTELENHRRLFDVWMRPVAGGSRKRVVAKRLPARAARQSASAKPRPRRGRRGPDFPGKVDRGRHLARLQLADNGSGHAAHNAHATASDALGAGVPVITCTGQAFAGRVASSLLRAADLRNW